MAITYKELNNVAYPAFRLPSVNWESKDGLLYVDHQIVDDTNMPGGTLGIRRLQTPFKSLLPLKKAYEYPIALIKDSSGPYIDFSGKLFIYEKVEFSKLKYYKIKHIDKKVIASLLWLHGVHFPVTVPRPPPPEYTWAGMLHIKELPWILYDYATEKLKETRRKI